MVVAQRICGRLRRGYVVAGRLDPSENKAKSVQIQLNLPVGTELGNITDRLNIQTYSTVFTSATAQY